MKYIISHKGDTVMLMYVNNDGTSGHHCWPSVLIKRGLLDSKIVVPIENDSERKKI